MYRPTEELDDSANYEMALAIRLLEMEPTPMLSRVDLTPFLPLKAKVDCITISFPWEITQQQMEEMNVLMGKRWDAPMDGRGPWFITVQDPTLADLRYLMKNFPNQSVDRLEIAVDAHLPPGCNDVYLLRRLKEQIRHCLAVQDHVWFDDVKREYFDLKSRRWLHDSAAANAPLTTVNYESRKTGMGMKIYIKTIDGKSEIGTPFVRTELTLTGVAPDHAGIYTIADLPQFSRKLRKFCSDAFSFGKGYKTGDSDGTIWQKYGAAWTFNQSKGLKLDRDKEANKAFGTALSNLRRSLVEL